jgi:hypothetical protein
MASLLRASLYSLYHSSMKQVAPDKQGGSRMRLPPARSPFFCYCEKHFH